MKPPEKVNRITYNISDVKLKRNDVQNQYYRVLIWKERSFNFQTWGNERRLHTITSQVKQSTSNTTTRGKQSMLLQGTVPLKKRHYGSNISKALEQVPIGLWAVNRRFQQWHVSPPLVKVGNAMFTCNCWAETRLDFPCFQLLPVYWLKPLVGLYLLTPFWSAAKALTRLLL